MLKNTFQRLRVLILFFLSITVFSCANIEIKPCKFSNIDVSKSFDVSEYKSIEPNDNELIFGVRLDPSYLALSHPNHICTSMAVEIIDSLKKSGVNTIFLYAYSSVYGSYYPTNYPLTTIEPTFGQANIFRNIAFQAKKQGLRVVASVPINNFKYVWKRMPSWRSLSMSPEKRYPDDEVRLLSASHPEFQEWLKGFIDDLISRNPEIDAVEAVEPTVDHFWEQKHDYNDVAVNKFKVQYPKSQIDGKEWAQFRSDELTNLIKIFNFQVHKNNRKTALVQTWPARKNGTLYPEEEVTLYSGFSFKEVSSLANEYQTDFLSVELIWQHWYSSFGNKIFNPKWIKLASKDMLSQLRYDKTRSTLLLHFELTKFNGQFDSVAPSDDEFNQTLELVKKMKYGTSIYDYNQLFNRKLIK